MERLHSTGRPVMDWLLGEGKPSGRHHTLTDLLGRREDDPDVRQARQQIALKRRITERR